MASAFQGFDIVLNLSESDSSDSDRTILNNLGGGNISNDLLLFYNNLRNFSQITVAFGDISGNTITKPGALFVFTNGTKITVGSTVYYVKDSDNQTSFRLSTSPDLSTTVANPPVGEYRRSDALTLENLTNLAIDRPRVVEDVSGSREYEGLSDLSDEELYRLNTSLIAMVNAFSTERYPTSASGYLVEIGNALDSYDRVSDKSIKRDADFTTSSGITFNGTIQVVDSSNLNASALPQTSNPGLFIVNPKTGEYSRAFSSNENVWAQNGANLQVDSSSLIIGELAFTGSNGIDLLSKDDNIIVQDVAPSANLDFTDYIDVEINGEPYSLCLFTYTIGI